MIIAEIGTSHEGSLQKAKELIDAATNANADFIKFQIVYAKEILHPKTGYVKLPTGNIPLYDKFCALECPISFYKELINYVHEKGKKFICSPFGIQSLNELLSIKPDAIKIASPELNHFELLTELANFRKKQPKNEKIPVIISSGVSTLSDIEKALVILGTENVFLLHCVTSYPAPETDYNLRLIKNLSNIFGIDCGVSDHSLDPILVPTLSVACGAKIIEKHITLSKNTSGLDDPVALEPEQFATMVHVVHQAETTIAHYGVDLGQKRIIEQLNEQFGNEKVESVLGTGVKKLALSEKENYGRTNRSLHYSSSFKCGHKISKDDILILRTEKVLSQGISPENITLLIGKTLTKDVIDGEGVQLEDFMN